MIKKIKILSLAVILSQIIFSISAFCQITYVHISYSNIYDLLDELANEKIIDINSTVKPYSRQYIITKLKDARVKTDNLSVRQIKDIDFYLKEFSFDENSDQNPISQQSKLDIFNRQSHFATSIIPLGIYYKDSLLTIAGKPIWGISYSSNSNGYVRHIWGGAEAFADIGNHLGMYASLRDNSLSDILSCPTYFNQLEGANYKNADQYSEMRGGIILNWKWGNIGIIKDHIEWGDNYHGSNIFSGRTPSFAMIKLQLYPARWIDFNYFHGWLVSEVIDSLRTYYSSPGIKRTIFRQKYIAANLLTIRPIRNINISIGNSIIYSDMNVHPAYLIPVMFYKSIDHTLNHGIDNQNSQMYGSISIRSIKHINLYSSLYLDEFSISRVFNPTRHNFTSIKAGCRISNWPLKNIIITCEFTRTNPLTYKHRVPSLTFESNKYNLGHYLRDNSQELYIEVQIKPASRLNLTVYYIDAMHGNEYAYLLKDTVAVDAHPVLKNISWKDQTLGFKSSYEFTTNSYLFFEFEYSSINGYDLDGKSAQYYLDLFTPKFYQGKTNTLSVGFNIGF